MLLVEMECADELEERSVLMSLISVSVFLFSSSLLTHSIKQM